MIAIDTETWCDDPCPVQRLVSVAFGWGATLQQTSLHVAHDPHVPAMVEHALEHGAVLMNAPFDILVLLREYPQLLRAIIRAYDAGKILDVAVSDKLWDYASDTWHKGRKYSLLAIAERRCGIRLDKSVRSSFGELLGLELDQWDAERQHYARMDVVATWCAQAKQPNYVHAWSPVHVAGHLALTSASLVGIDVDAAQVERVEKRLAQEMADARPMLMASKLARWEGVEQVGSRWYAKRGRERKGPFITQDQAGECAEAWRPKGSFKRDENAARAMLVASGLPITQTEKGPSLSKAALEVVPDDHPLAAYRRYGAAQTLRSKSLRPLRFGRVYTRYDELKSTGRTGSSAFKDGPYKHCSTNLQNQAREGGFREALVAPEGHSFVIADYKTAELVAWADVLLALFGESPLADALIAGRDVHADLGALILGVPCLDLKIPAHKQARQLAKAPNFGYPGGLGAPKFVQFAKSTYGIIITEERARELKSLWVQKWRPEQYFAWVNRLPQVQGKFVLTHPITGRVRTDYYTKVCNSTYQELAAVGAKQAGWDLWKARAEGLPAWQVLFVHDEWVSVCRDEHVEQCVPAIRRIMIDGFAKWVRRVPVEVDMKVSKRYEK